MYSHLEFPVFPPKKFFNNGLTVINERIEKFNNFFKFLTKIYKEENCIEYLKFINIQCINLNN